MPEVSGDYYGLLGVPPDASPEEIQRGYRELAKLLHPDAHAGRHVGTRQAAEARFKALQEAYWVLSDPDRRAVYDRGRGGPAPSSDAGPVPPSSHESYDDPFSEYIRNRTGPDTGGPTQPSPSSANRQPMMQGWRGLAIVAGALAVLSVLPRLTGGGGSSQTRPNAGVATQPSSAATTQPSASPGARIVPTPTRPVSNVTALVPPDWGRGVCNGDSFFFHGLCPRDEVVAKIGFTVSPYDRPVHNVTLELVVPENLVVLMGASNLIHLGTVDTQAEASFTLAARSDVDHARLPSPCSAPLFRPPCTSQREGEGHKYVRAYVGFIIRGDDLQETRHDAEITVAVPIDE